MSLLFFFLIWMLFDSNEKKRKLPLYFYFSRSFYIHIRCSSCFIINTATIFFSLSLHSSSHRRAKTMMICSW